MSGNYYQLYIDSVVDLANTLTIKSEETARNLNSYIQAIGGSDAVSDDPRIWKYYLNISGEYHPLDEKIYVTSLDTLEKILFSKANLDLHTQTKKAYQYGTRFYRELLSVHAEKELLIRGILYPCNIDTAINSQDGTILAYPSYLVEDNEVTLIENIQNWIYKFHFRWQIKPFGIAHNLYPASFFGQLCLNLIPLILNLRLKACKTKEAHSFHIRQYLASHGGLDKYLDYMTKEQALYFYRNIAYLERNSGKKDIFYWLEENIMSKRNLPLSEFNLKHDDTSIPVNYDPTPVFKRTPINKSIDNLAKINYSLDDVLDLEKPESIGNVAYIEEQTKQIDTSLKYSLSDNLDTKLLYSDVTNYTDSGLLTLEEIVINYWGYLTHKSKYNIFINFKHPTTSELYTIRAKDAYIYAMYCYGKYVGCDFDIVPEYYINRVQIDPKPTLDELMSVVDNTIITRETAESLQMGLPAIRNITSVEDFTAFSNQLFDFNNGYVALYRSFSDHYKKAQVRNLGNRLFQDTKLVFTDSGEDMSDWLIDKKLPTDNFEPYQYLNIFNELLLNATGYSSDKISDFSKMQKSMVSIFSKLASYSVQFISKINETRLKIIEMQGSSISDNDIGESKIKLSYHNHVLDLDQDCLFTGFTINDKLVYESNFALKYSRFKHTLKYGIKLDIPVKPRTGSRYIASSIIRINNTFNTTVKSLNHDSNNYIKNNIAGIEYFNSLTPEQKLEIKEPDCDCPKYLPKNSNNRLWRDIQMWVDANVWMDT